MTLLTKAKKNKIPALYETEPIDLADKIARVKFFHPLSHWTWYVIDFDGNDTCWGLASGHEAEFGYFSLKEITHTIALGLPVERDRFFRPTQVRDLAAFGKGGMVY